MFDLIADCVRKDCAAAGRPERVKARPGVDCQAMTDLLDGARDLRQKLFRLEVLLEVQKGGRSRAWFTSKAPAAAERAAAITRLTETGLIEPVGPPEHFKLTVEGHDFVRDLRAKVGAGQALDWTHADEIDFSRL